MRSPREIGRCRLCGCTTELTEEHVPPRRAFNDSQVLMYKLDRGASPSGGEARLAPVGRPRQGGHRAYTLCAKCNNDTGSWYAGAYVRFAKECARHAHPGNADGIVGVSASDMFPLRVAKQALVIVCSCCTAKLTERRVVLRDLLLCKTNRGLPYPLRLFAYLNCAPGGRSSGVSGVLRVHTGEARVVAEFAAWPLGWVLSFNPLPVAAAADVTHWADHSYSERIGGPIHLPCRWATTPWPLDFRSPDQVLRDMERDSSGM